jgi:DHA1 family multidrug resistance protein-like MFS transporter
MRLLLQRRQIVLALSVYALITIGANFQHPVTPAYLNDIGLARSLYGFLFAFMALGLSVAAPISGRLTDSMGTRWLLVMGLTGYGLFQILFGSVTNIVLLVLARFGAGISVAFVFPIMISYVVKITNKQERSVALALLTASQLLFVSVGYFIGGQLDRFVAPQTIFYVQGAALFVIAGISLVLPNVQVVVDRTLSLQFAKVPRHGWYMIAMFFLISAVTMTVIRYFDVYMIDLGYSAAQLGQYILLTGVVGVITNLWLLPYLLRRVHDVRLLQLVVLSISITLFVTFSGVQPFLVGLFTSYLLFYMARSMYDPLHNNYISRLSDYQGQVIGMSESAKMMGMFLGPILGGYVYAVSPDALFLTAAVIGAIAFGFSLRIHQDKKLTPTKRKGLG